MAISSSTPEPSNSSVTLTEGLNPNAQPFRILTPNASSRKTASCLSQVPVLFLPHDMYRGLEQRPPVLPPQPTLPFYTAPSFVLPQQQMMAFPAQPWQYSYPFETMPLSSNVRCLYQPCYSSFGLQPVMSSPMVLEGAVSDYPNNPSKLRFSIRSKNSERFRRTSQQTSNVGQGKPSKKLEWKVKPVLESCGETLAIKSEMDEIPALIPFPTIEEETVNQGITTVMIKNIPNNFRRRDLMAILDKHCRAENLKEGEIAKAGVPIPSKYDLIYLPMDYRKHHYENKFANLGYAFVNFTTPVAAFRFYREFNGYRWTFDKSSKICQVSPAQYQGNVLKEKFACKTFLGSSREFRPIVLSSPRDGFVQNTYAIPIGKFKFGIPQRRQPNYRQKHA